MSLLIGQIVTATAMVYVIAWWEVTTIKLQMKFAREETKKA